MFFLISIFWFIRTTKNILFWIYLWQLKEYHFGRFLNHFKTHKGKKLIYQPLQLFKIILVGFSLLSGSIFIILPLILFLLYFVESVFVFRSFLGRKLKIPVWTQKTIILALIGLLFLIFFLIILFLIVKNNIFWFAFWLLIFDVFTPKITSIIVLLLQIPTVLWWRNRLIKKAKEKRKKFKDLIVIGITGSYGKTSTKEFLAIILDQKFPGKVLKTKEHQNSEVGIAKCILNDLKPKHQIFVAEVGAYNLGKIKEVCNFLQPKIGILTGINEQHIATFGSQENIIEGKYELIESLPKDGIAIFNGNNKYCQELFQRTEISKKIIYNNFSMAVEKLLDFEPNVWAQDIKVEKESLIFKVISKDGDKAEFKVNLIGKENIENILLATCCAKELGMKLKEVSIACNKIRKEDGSIKLKKMNGRVDILDSSYSANPHSVISHLEHLKLWSGKKIIIMPCLIELGSFSKEIHKKIGEKIGEVCDLAIITTKDNFKEIKEGATKKKMKEENLLFIEKPREIFEKIKNFCKPNDIILLEGRINKELTRLLK